jgi:hypothetical protein
VSALIMGLCALRLVFLRCVPSAACGCGLYTVWWLRGQAVAWMVVVCPQQWRSGATAWECWPPLRKLSARPSSQSVWHRCHPSGVSGGDLRRIAAQARQPIPTQNSIRLAMASLWWCQSSVGRVTDGCQGLAVGSGPWLRSRAVSGLLLPIVVGFGSAGVAVSCYFSQIPAVCSPIRMGIRFRLRRRQPRSAQPLTKDSLLYWWWVQLVHVPPNGEDDRTQHTVCGCQKNVKLEKRRTA